MTYTPHIFLINFISLFLMALTPIMPYVETAQLDNGLKIIVITNKHSPVITHMLWYKVGSADDPIGKSGLAHYLEHLMFKGTKTLKPGEFSQIISQMGGENNAFTSYDYTAYFQRIPSDKLEIVMQMNADLMQNLILTDEVTISERNVILEERSSRNDSRPRALLNEKMRKTLYGQHPYHIPIIGWRHEIETLTTQDAMTFYRQHYTVDNALLVIMGSIDMIKVKSFAQATYGAITSQKTTTRKRDIKQDNHSSDTLYLTDARIDNYMWQRIYKLQKWEDKNIRQMISLELLIKILAQGSTSKLYQKLVKETKTATNITAQIHTSLLDYSEVIIHAMTQSSEHISAMIHHIEQIIMHLKTHSVTDEELSQAKTQLLTETLFAQDRQETVTQIYGTHLILGRDIKSLGEWQQQIESITPTDIKAVARLLLESSKSITALLTPFPYPH